MNLGLSRTRHAPASAVLSPYGSVSSLPGVPTWTMELMAASRSCCCSARPAVAVIVPSAPEIALLMCGHHYRASHDALTARAAIAYDRNGCVVTDELWPAP
jgi:hypothetical protein